MSTATATANNSRVSRKGLIYAAVKTEGALLPPDLLTRIANSDADLGGFAPESYGLAPGERLSDAILQSWNRLSGVWSLFAASLESAPETETTYEAQTRKEWLIPLLHELGFDKPTVADPVVIDDRDYPIRWRSGDIALHLVGARVDLDRRAVFRGVPTGRAPHGMVQEFLNRSDEHLWALVTNGLRVRLLRDNSSLTRQAYCEFDLEAIFRGQEFAEFALFWLVCHASRLEGSPQSTCWLEKWSNQAVSDGVRALEALRAGVEAAIETIGSGLLAPTAHPRNVALRARLRDGSLSTADYQRQLLRVIYRLLFLLVAESRDALLAPDANPEAKLRYRRYYSVTRLVDLARRQRGSHHTDLWTGLNVTFGALERDGIAALGLAPLGSAMWSNEFTDELNGCVLSNRSLLDAVDQLTTIDDRGARRRVDYRNLGSEELGGVYESLLETHAEVNVEAATFSLSIAAGNERKTTGSYYTPTSLIRELLDSALDPVLDEAEASGDPEVALLALKVIDPAAGSGHFLIAAAHRIAHRLAAVRSQESEPSPDELRHALREVIGHCIYGVDINPMSAELCKVSLWMEAMEPGRPLSFLDHRIKCGNSLLGTTPKLIADGVPNEAFKGLTGDNKSVVSAFRKVNSAELKATGQGVLQFDSLTAADAAVVAAKLADLDNVDSDSVVSMSEKERHFADLQRSSEMNRLKLAADAWCAAFVSPKRRLVIDGVGPDGEAPTPSITTSTVRACSTRPESVDSDTLELIRSTSAQYRFFHLHVEFPDVFAVPQNEADAENPDTGWSGGFDVVLGNPPWDQIQYDPQETFAVSHPEIAGAPTMAKRNKLIAALEVDEPETYAHYLRDVRELDGVKHFVHGSQRYPLGSVGRLNTAPLFVELMWTSINQRGRVGVVTPTGIATDSFTQGFFNAMVDREALVSLFDFENRLAIFPGVHRSFKFALVTLSGAARSIPEAEFVFFALAAADLDDPEKRFTLSPEDFALLNPNTRTCPVFRTRRDAEITKGIYRRVPVLVKEGDPDGNPWGVSFQLMFMMNTDSHLFRTRDELEGDGFQLHGNHFVRGDERYLPLYEAKMLHHFDHRWATYDGDQIRDVTLAEKQDPNFVVMPRYWIPDSTVGDRSGGRPLSGWRKICRSTDERTFIVGSPGNVGAGDNLLLFWPSSQRSSDTFGLQAMMSSLAFDFVARQKLGGTNFQYFIAKQLPVLTREAVEASLAAKLALELTYTGSDLQRLAKDLGYDGPPFKWDEDRRAFLRAELDALMFRLYGIERNDVDYIMDTFPIVKRKDEAAFGEYRTKRLILERYDAMAAAEAAGDEYESILYPPPADPRCAHPESTRPAWAVQQ